MAQLVKIHEGVDMKRSKKSSTHKNVAYSTTKKSRFKVEFDPVDNTPENVANVLLSD